MMQSVMKNGIRLDDRLIPEEQETSKNIFGMSERVDDHPTLNPRSAPFVSRFGHFLHFFEQGPVGT
jgi:hypothetical protein